LCSLVPRCIGCVIIRNSLFGFPSPYSLIFSSWDTVEKLKERHRTGRRAGIHKIGWDSLGWARILGPNVEPSRLRDRVEKEGRQAIVLTIKRNGRIVPGDSKDAFLTEDLYCLASSYHCHSFSSAKWHPVLLNHNPSKITPCS